MNKEMKNELKEMIRSVMKEELSGINEKVDWLESNHNDRFDKLELVQEKIQAQLRSSTKDLEETVKEHIIVIVLLHKEVKPQVEFKGRED